jgi:UDP-sugar diphosphatase
VKNIIEDFKIEELKEPNFIKAGLVTYKQNGIAKTWEVVEAHDSVAILIYHKEHKSFVLVKQFRPAVYMGNKDGLTVELCAGIVDKDLSLVEIASEEITEECGYLVPISKIEKITEVNSAVGFAGSKQTIFYVEVDESMHISDGGGIDNELIEVIEIPTSNIREFIYDESIAKTTGLLFAFMWWIDKYQK